MLLSVEIDAFPPIIIIKSLQGLALDIWEGFHALLVTVDCMDIFKPGYIAFLDGCF